MDSNNNLQNLLKQLSPEDIDNKKVILSPLACKDFMDVEKATEQFKNKVFLLKDTGYNVVGYAYVSPDFKIQVLGKEQYPFKSNSTRQDIYNWYTSQMDDPSVECLGELKG